MITTKAYEDIVPPQIAFNPEFNPFSTDLKPVREIPFLRNNNENRMPSAANWGSLYEIITPQTQDQNEFFLGGRKQVELHGFKNQKMGERQIFQLHHRFIISQIKSGFMLIDQQAAHERILYERFLQQLENRQGASQQSLFPQSVSLNPGDFELVKDLLPDIQALGFQIREFGRNTVVVEGIPADLGNNISEVEMLEHLIEGFKNNQSALKLDKRDNLARSLAKNAAVKAGTALSAMEMNLMVDELFACTMPNTSLNGKPVIITVTLEELIQKFDK